MSILAKFSFLVACLQCSSSWSTWFWGGNSVTFSKVRLTQWSSMDQVDVRYVQAWSQSWEADRSTCYQGTGIASIDEQGFSPSHAGSYVMALWQVILTHLQYDLGCFFSVEGTWMGFEFKKGMVLCTRSKRQQLLTEHRWRGSNMRGMNSSAWWLALRYRLYIEVSRGSVDHFHVHHHMPRCSMLPSSIYAIVSLCKFRHKQIKYLMYCGHQLFCVKQVRIQQVHELKKKEKEFIKLQVSSFFLVHQTHSFYHDVS
jgi:hypothetical protein